jgi:adenine-specific DNA-methyltransferase
VTAALRQKAAGAYYTPNPVVQTLLKWAIHNETDRFLDPSCGDGRFIAAHRNSVGIEQDAAAAHTAMLRAPWALVHEGDFFSWAAETPERFAAVGGNPPFIRYQTFKGEVRARAIALCNALGARFSGLASSWAPFLVASASLLQPGGRIAFVVPAEIGHAPYAAPVLEYLAANFEVVHVVAYRDKLFPELSEDCWLLYAEGFGGCTTELRFTALDSFEPLPSPPPAFTTVNMIDWQRFWNRRLRPFILPAAIRDLYIEVLGEPDTKRLRDLARVGIGYVSGNNNFFHLRPSEAAKWKIPKAFLRPTVRRSEYLPARRLTAATVEKWRRADEQVLLLNIPKTAKLPSSVRRYLETDEAKSTQTAYKCQNRAPWYSVPDVLTPEFFLTYMSGRTASLVRNDAHCTCTNSVHAVRFRHAEAASALTEVWDTDFLRLSCELEGHPLGGGMLKLEPGEAAQIMVPSPSTVARLPTAAVTDAVSTMRQWRHYAATE